MIKSRKGENTMVTTKIIDFWIFMAALMIAAGISKKEPERFKKLMADTLGYVMGIGLVLSFIEFLAMVGLEILEVAWSFSPLDFMAAVSYLFFFALCAEKWSLSRQKSTTDRFIPFKNPLKWWKN